MIVIESAFFRTASSLASFDLERPHSQPASLEGVRVVLAPKLRFGCKILMPPIDTWIPEQLIGVSIGHCFFACMTHWILARCLGPVLIFLGSQGCVDYAGTGHYS